MKPPMRKMGNQKVTGKVWGATTSLIIAEEIRKSFGGYQVLKNISFRLDPGEIIILRGENGSGKTTLLNILSGSLTPDGGTLQLHRGAVVQKFTWPISFLQRLNPLDSFTPEKMAQSGLGRLWQDIRLFKTFSVLDNVCTAAFDQSGENPLQALLQFWRVSVNERQNRAKAEEVLGRLGIADRGTSSCDRLSLGQMKRVALARLIHSNTRVLLLDEPLAGLDDRGRNEFLKYMEEIATKGDYTVVIVEHVLNLPRILSFGTQVWTLENGRLHTDTPDTVLRELEPAAVEFVDSDSFQLRYREQDSPGDMALNISNLDVRRGNRPVLDRYSLQIPEGRKKIIAYRNGWGKTTLLDAIAGLIPVDKGCISVFGTDLTGKTAWQRARRGISYLRSRENTFPRLTVKEHLALIHREPTIFSVFPQWADMMPSLDLRAEALSGGERQRLALGCLPLRPVMLLDEPFLGLDHEAMICLASIVKQLDATVLIAVPSTQVLPPDLCDTGLFNGL